MANKEFNPRIEFGLAMDAEEFQGFHEQYDAVYSAICIADGMVHDFGIKGSLGIRKNSADERMFSLFLAQRVLKTQIYDLGFAQRFRQIADAERATTSLTEGLRMVEEYIQDRKDDSFSEGAERNHLRIIELAANELFASATESCSERAVTMIKKPDKNWLKGWDQRWRTVLNR